VFLAFVSPLGFLTYLADRTPQRSLVEQSRTQRVLHSIFCTRVLLHIRGAYSNSGPYSDSRAYNNQSISLQNYSGRRDHPPRLEIRKDVSVEKTIESGSIGVWMHRGGGSRFGTGSGRAWASDVFLSDSFAVSSPASVKFGSDLGEGDKDVLDSESARWQEDEEFFDLGDPVIPRLSMNGRATVHSASDDEEAQWRFSGTAPPSFTESRVGVAL